MLKFLSGDGQLEERLCIPSWDSKSVWIIATLVNPSTTDYSPLNNLCQVPQLMENWVL